MGFRTVCIDILNTTTVVVLFCIRYLDSVIRLGPINVWKKKIGKESQYIVSCLETGSDSPIGLDRESGCDIVHRKHRLNLLKGKMIRKFSKCMNCVWNDLLHMKLHIWNDQ